MKNSGRLTINSAAIRYAKNHEKIKQTMVEASIATLPHQGDQIPRYVNRLIQLGRHDLAAQYLDCCSKGITERTTVLERIIKQNELMGIAFFERGRSASRAVCRVVIRNSLGETLGYGTGFMVSSRLLMTNNHVIENQSIAANCTIEFDYAYDALGKEMPVQRYSLEPDKFFETDNSKPGLDFTIVAVKTTNDDGHHVKNRGWMHLIPASGKAVIGEPVNIIQHPAGQRMQVAFRSNKIVAVYGDYLSYTTDTLAGSSGSMVVNDQWQLAALHHAGIPKTDANQNWLKKDGLIFNHQVDDPDTIHWIANEGIRISKIIEYMLKLPLSASQLSIFEETFIPSPPFKNLSSPEQNIAANNTSGNHLGGPHINSDGLAMWDFQLTFGPKTAEQPSPSIINKPSTHTPKVDIASAVKSPNGESVFKSRGAYYDDAADKQNAALYYNSITKKPTKAQLFSQLNLLITNSHKNTFSYRKARHEFLYPWIDRHDDQTLKSIYSGEIMPEELFLNEITNYNQLVEFNAQNQLHDNDLDEVDIDFERTSVFNCEHVVPQSWFADQKERQIQKSDMHHLFTCDSACNSFRSNIPYFEFSPEQEDEINAKEIHSAEALQNPNLEASRLNCGLRNGRRFEPTAGKAAVARATLYFLLRYPGVIGDIKTGKKKEFVKSNVKILLDWADDQKPSLYEKHRNAEIAKVQGNRNPLIDRPEWLRKIKFENGFG